MVHIFCVKICIVLFLSGYTGLYQLWIWPILVEEVHIYQKKVMSILIQGIFPISSYFLLFTRFWCEYFP